MSGGGWLGGTLVHLDRVDSTSDELWRRARAGAPHGTVLRADVQTAGRGRQGRSWVSAPGNLLVSWLLRLPSTPASFGALSVVQGLALASVLDRRAPGRVHLKWPNDLWLDGRKLGGLLLESRSSDGLCVVSGLGLNLATPVGGWADLDGRAAALDELGPAPDPAQTLDLLLPAVEGAIDRFLAGRVAEALAEWPRFSALDGRSIRWEDPDGRGRGRVVGLATDGGLRVELPGGRARTLYAGEVHLEGVR